jgi:hypothetical protein
MAIKYQSTFVKTLHEDIAALIEGDSARRESVRAGLHELCVTNAPQVQDYWQTMKLQAGVPDSAFKKASIYYYSDQEPVKTFKTSGTTGASTGQAAYSPMGLELMQLSIIANAKRNMLKGLDHAGIVRLVPTADAAPHMVMAYGMECIARRFGYPHISRSVVGANGVDFKALDNVLTAAIAENLPVILIGASFSYVNICDQLLRQGKQWQLPAGSRCYDAGGFKTVSRIVSVPVLRGLVNKVFGIAPENAGNLFGMTELASQLYDEVDVGVGPLDERPKLGGDYVNAIVRDPFTLRPVHQGRGLVEIEDLCIVDRPHIVLSGDLGIASAHGVAIVGRAERGKTRGCSLSLDKITTQESAYA